MKTNIYNISPFLRSEENHTLIANINNSVFEIAEKFDIPIGVVLVILSSEILAMVCKAEKIELEKLFTSVKDIYEGLVIYDEETENRN